MSGTTSAIVPSVARSVEVTPDVLESKSLPDRLDELQRDARARRGRERAPRIKLGVGDGHALGTPSAGFVVVGDDDVDAG